VSVPRKASLMLRFYCKSTWPSYRHRGCAQRLRGQGPRLHELLRRDAAMHLPQHKVVLLSSKSPWTSQD